MHNSLCHKINSIFAYGIEWAFILCDDGHLCPAKLLHYGSNCRRNIHIAGEGAKECLKPLAIVQSW